MDRSAKSVQIGDITSKFDKSTSAVFLDFKGLPVSAVTALRQQFRAAGVDYKVVKNTFVKQATKETKGGEGLKKLLVGMTGVAWAYDDPSAAAKVVKAFRKTPAGEKLTIKGGLIDGQILDAKSVEDQLATMPGKDELRAMLLATMQAPLQQFVALLQAPAQNFAYLLDAKKREAEGA
jgi:large subunit ribosomal protein L10